MIKRVFNIFYVLVIVLSACKDKDINVFDKTADERVTEALANLKADLTAPANGFKVKYKPADGGGSYYALMKFNEDNSLIIQTDFTGNGGRFLIDTVTYRIESSLGLQLIIENYSFFSYLFEQGNASFPAEYEFIYVNKTPDNALVFKSKTDSDNPTILTLIEATVADQSSLLGLALSDNLNTLSEDLLRVSSSLTLTYQNKDLVFYTSIDELQRIITFNAASKKTNTASVKSIDFSTGYDIKKDSMVFDTALEGLFLGTNISIKGIKFNTTLGSSGIDVCTDPIPTHLLTGVTSANQQVTFETSLIDVSGKSFTTLSTIYYCPLNFIIDNGVSVDNEIENDIPGAVEFVLYYNAALNDGTKLYGIGFVIQNEDESFNIAVREFTPTLTDNNLIFDFKPGLRLMNDTPITVDLNKINIYLDALTSGNQTYVFKFIENRYEFFNPCTGWSFVLINANQ
jgi:hypothetical protein